MQAPPFRLTEALNLASIPVDPQYFRFTVAALESDKYVSVRDKSADGSEQLTVVDMSNNGKVIRTKNDAEAALMHPSQNIIALRKAPDAGSSTVIVQVWNLDTKQKLKNCEFTEKIVYWHWVNNSKLAIVTVNSAYHLNINNPNENQVKILDRASANPDSAQQILGYSLEPNEKWCVVFGIGTPDGGKTINGSVQLFFIDAGKQQLLEGFAPTFGEVYIHSEDHKSLIFAFVEKKAGDPTIKIQLTEIGAPKEGCAKFKKFADLQLSPEFGNDFPIASHISTKYGLLYVVTKFGFVFVYEITSAQLVFKSRLSQDNVFCVAKSSEDGILALTRGGQVLSLNVEPSSFIPYLLNQCKHIPDIQSLAFKLAGRNKLTGMDSMFLDQFNRCIIAGDYAGAARTAADAPGTLLRNQETIAKFKSLQSQPGQPQPLLVYFSTLLEKGKLNALESIELCGPVLAQGRKQLVEDWLNQDKLQCTPELGELVEKVDPSLALTVYKRAGNKEKEVQILMSLGRHDEAMSVSQAAGMKTDYSAIIKNILVTNPEGALATAKGLVAKDPGMNVHAIAELFLQANRVKEFTAFLVDCMRENKPEDGPCQTKALELNLMMAPHIAETIFQMEIWSQYNKQKIAPLCEQKGLMQRALENYTELKDIRRVILHTHVLNAEFLANYLGKLPAESLLACLGDLLRHNRQNVQLVVSVCTVQHPKIGVANIIKMFESLGNFDGIFLFLRSILNQTEDPDIYFKYIEAACKCNQFQAVEAVIKESTFYDPVKVKNLLKDLKIPDPRPLMYLCDMHGFIDELTRYLYQNNFQKFIEVYIFKVNPTAAPIVLGTLIDLECDEAYIKRLLGAIMSNCPIDALIEEFDKRNKIRLLESWLEARAAEGNQTPSIHNALAKICIDTNKDPQNFLMNNQYYDSKVIGKYCEERDPHLAYLAYKRAWGQCDMELIEVTNKNALYRLQARYLVERKSKELWALVLTPDNPHRRNIIEQVVSSALPDSKNVEEVSVAVSAFLEADIPNELMNLLEKIVLHNSEFSGFQKLQNLLIITAMKTDKTRVMDYINRLDNYDGPAMAKIALGEQYQLYEEAFVIYKKFKMNVEAVEVLVTNIDNIQRASEFAEKANQPEVWSKLAKAYLDREMVTEAIESYLKANDPKNYPAVILTAKTDGKYEQLIKFLLMARKQLKDGMIDSELAYAYAKLNKLAELEELVSNPNSIDIPSIGDKCYDDRLYEAAKIMYTQVKNNAKIASCLVHLKQFQAAIDAAKKANTPRTWKELCMACVAAGEYRLASVAGMNIIIHPDHLDDLIQHYEKYLVPDEIISLLETGMQLDHAHIGIFTELGILYAKYHPQKLMEHCKLHFSKLNITKLNRVCERYCLWNEAVYLYSHYDEHDTAVNIMIEHSPTAWQHELFVSTLQKVSNIDLYYKAVLFYVDEQPMLLNDLLKPLAAKIDLTRLISTMKKTGYIALITPFLKNVQSQNNSAVNEALNNIYFESDDYESLRNSVTNFDNFDAQALASLCEKHQLLEFRRIAAYLYRKNKQYAQSIKLSKQDEIYRDAIETALESKSAELVDDLMKFFVGNGEKEFFTVTLYTCYELLKPDYVLELAWRFNLTDFAMPYFVQILRELTSKVEVVQKKHEDREKKDQKEAEAKQNEPIFYGTDMSMMAGANPQLMLMGPGVGGFPPQSPMDMGMGMGGSQFGGNMGGGYGY